MGLIGNLISWFNSKPQEIEQQSAEIEVLKEEVKTLKAASDLSDSLMAFTPEGNVVYYDTNQGGGYKDHYTIYKGIDLLATLGSSIPLDVYSGKELLEPDTILKPKHFNLEQPNPNMSIAEIHKEALVYFFYRGEYMIEIKESPFFHLVPVNPKHMTRNHNGVNWKNTKDRRVILDENLIYVKLLNPDNSDGRGLGPVEVVKADILNEKKSVEYNTSWFQNYGQMAGFFYDSEGKARPNDMQRIVDQAAGMHSGSKKAGQNIGLPGGIRYEEFKQTMAEMQYLESRKDIRDRILAVLGIHKALFGVTDSVDRAVADAAVRMLWLYNLKPKLKLIQEKWNSILFRNFLPIYNCKFDFSEVAELKQSVDVLDKQAKMFKFLGYTTNEINETLKLGMEDIDDPALNVRMVPNSMTPFSEFEAEEEDEAKASLEPDTDGGGDDLLSEYLEDETIVAARKVSQQRYIREEKKLLRSTSRKIAGPLGKFFSSELGDVIKIVLGEKQSDASINVNMLLAKISNKINENKPKLQVLIKPIYTEASIAADILARSMLGDTGVAKAAERIVEKLTSKIPVISDYTYKLIRNQVKDGVAAGETLEGISKRIQKVYKFNSSRSRMIARTETSNIVHQSVDKRYRESNVKKKEWLSSGGPDSRESHDHNASMGVVDYDFIYSNGQKFPGDGNGGSGENVNCRCTYCAVVD